jgi:hypothetical protein
MDAMLYPAYIYMRVDYISRVSRFGTVSAQMYNPNRLRWALDNWSDNVDPSRLPHNTNVGSRGKERERERNLYARVFEMEIMCMESSD